MGTAPDNAPSKAARAGRPDQAALHAYAPASVLAAALPELPYACGLGTIGLLADDVVTDPLVPVDGWLAVRRVVVDPERLARHPMTADEQAAWTDRLSRTRALDRPDVGATRG